MEPIQNRVKNKLTSLIADINVSVKKNISSMSYDEIDFIMKNYSKHLRYDLMRDFEEAKEKHLAESPFGGIMDDNG